MLENFYRIHINFQLMLFRFSIYFHLNGKCSIQMEHAKMWNFLQYVLLNRIYFDVSRYFITYLFYYSCMYFESRSFIIKESKLKWSWWIQNTGFIILVLYLWCTKIKTKRIINWVLKIFNSELVILGWYTMI